MAPINAEQMARRARLVELLSQQILDVEPGFDETSNLFEAGLDSMAIMQLLLLVEREFGVRLPVAKLTRENFSSVCDLAKLIGEQLGE
jgi:acyl carrier protein